MAITVHVTTRVYGQIFGTPPFQDENGIAAFSNVKPFPIAPLTSVALQGANLWPLQNGILIGSPGTYVYSVIELPPAGLNQPSVKLATNDSVTTLLSAAT